MSDASTVPEQGGEEPEKLPSHDARSLTAGGDLATIVHLGQRYTLRITRQGKLILTK
ncbi:MAG: hemin uptake protein HemP [Pseudomonadota bacterium]